MPVTISGPAARSGGAVAKTLATAGAQRLTSGTYEGTLTGELVLTFEPGAEGTIRYGLVGGALVLGAGAEWSAPPDPAATTVRAAFDTDAAGVTVLVPFHEA